MNRALLAPLAVLGIALLAPFAASRGAPAPERLRLEGVNAGGVRWLLELEVGADRCRVVKDAAHGGSRDLAPELCAGLGERLAGLRPERAIDGAAKPAAPGLSSHPSHVMVFWKSRAWHLVPRGEELCQLLPSGSLRCEKQALDPEQRLFSWIAERCGEDAQAVPPSP